jgi:heat shock protein HslJ
MTILAALAMAMGLAAATVAQDEPAASGSPAASGPPASEELASPEGITWILQEQAVEGPAALEQLPQLVLASLIMEDGQAGGSSGCNSWFADYTLDGQALTFGTVGSTMMACPGPQSAVERAFFTNLGAVAAWASVAGDLRLSDATGQPIMRFSAAPEATVVGSWVAQGINDGAQAVVTTELTPLVTAVFEEDGRLSGSDGCNSYFTSYEVDGPAISISPEIASTLMLCPEEGLAELSQQYYAALAAATTWAVDDGGALELRDDEGALQVRYLPAE